MSQSDANSRSFLYSGASALTHTVTHNFNSRWVNYAVFFTADGVQLQPVADIDTVTALNANQLRVVLGSPAAVTIRVTT